MITSISRSSKHISGFLVCVPLPVRMCLLFSNNKRTSRHVSRLPFTSHSADLDLQERCSLVQESDTVALKRVCLNCVALQQFVMYAAGAWNMESRKMNLKEVNEVASRSFQIPMIVLDHPTFASHMEKNSLF